MPKLILLNLVAILHTPYNAVKIVHITAKINRYPISPIIRHSINILTVDMILKWVDLIVLS
jgi:hypothetical protein